jgi:hypothetical protein
LKFEVQASPKNNAGLRESKTADFLSQIIGSEGRVGDWPENATTSNSILCGKAR